MTTIQDTVTYIDGRTANGKIILTWPILQVGGVAIAAGQEEWPVVDGQVSITVYPNINAQPVGVYYTATYELDEGAVYDEFWIVPNTPTVTIATVRAQFPTTPSVMINAMQLTSSGAQPGMVLGWNGASWIPMYVSNFNAPVQSVFGRSGVTGQPNIVAQTGDYSVEQITGAVGVTRRINTVLPLQGGGDLSQDLTLSVNPADVVPGTRQVIAGFGLTGGGPLITDVTLAVATSQLAGAGLQSNADGTLSVVPDTTVQQVQVALAGTVEGARPELNFVNGPGTSFNVADNAAANRVDITVSLTGSGPASPSIYSVNGAAIGTQPELNLIAGSGTTIAGVDNTALNRVDVTVQASAVGGVSSFNTRTGDVVPLTGDYSAFYPSMTGSYANPGWITSLPWSKITGAPAGAGFWQAGAGGAIYYSGGNVGIGVSAPLTALEVAASQLNSSVKIGGLELESYTATNNNITSNLYYNGSNWTYRTTGVASLLSLNAGGYSFNVCPSGTAGTSVTPTQVMVITPGGNVGVGTASPLSALEISGNSQPSLGFTATSGATGQLRGRLIYDGGSTIAGGGWVFQKMTDGGAFGANLVTIIQSSGNVGIGTTAPWRSLHVGNVPVGGGVAVTGVGPNFALSDLSNSDPNNNDMTAIFALATANGHYGLSAGDIYVASQGSARGNIYINANYSGGGAPRSVLMQHTGGAVGIGTQSPLAVLEVVGGSLPASSTYGALLVAATTTSQSDMLAMAAHTGDYCWIQAVAPGVAYRNLVLQPNAGNVGIGTLSPGGLLHVNSSSVCQVWFTSASGSGAYLELGQIGQTVELMSDPSGNFLVNCYSVANNVFEVMRLGAAANTMVLSQGKVGIGTTSPAYALDVNGSIQISGAQNLRFNPAADSGVVFSPGTQIIRRSSDGAMLIQGSQSNIEIRPAGNVAIVPPANPGTSLAANQLTIGEYTNAPGYHLQIGYYLDAGVAYKGSIQALQNNAATALALNVSGGGVGIGTASPDQALTVNGWVHSIAGGFQFPDGSTQSTAAGAGYWAPVTSGSGICYGGNVAVGTNTNIYAGSQYNLNDAGNLLVQGVPYSISYTGFTTVSDVVVKENVRPFSDGLDVILRMRPVRFEYNGVGLTESVKGATNVGVIAQELRDVAAYMVAETPETITEGGVKRAVLGTDLTAMPWLICNAIRELVERIEKLEKRRN